MIKIKVIKVKCVTCGKLFRKLTEPRLRKHSKYLKDVKRPDSRTCSNKCSIKYQALEYKTRNKLNKRESVNNEKRVRKNTSSKRKN